MLGKLLKHEWSITAKRYGLMYLVLVAMTLFAAVIHGIPTENKIFQVVETVFLGFYVLTLIAVMVCSFGVAVLRFYQNMVSDEGYLTFTLPVKVEELVATKVLVAMLWQVITVLLLLGSVFCVYVPGHMEMSTFFQKVASSLTDAGMPFAMVVVLLFAGVLYQLMLCCFSVSVGQTFQGNKILGSVLTYCVVDFGLKILMLVMLFVTAAVVGVQRMNKIMSFVGGVTTVLVGYAVWILLLAVVGYFGSCYFLKKKLNLN